MAVVKLLLERKAGIDFSDKFGRCVPIGQRAWLRSLPVAAEQDGPDPCLPDWQDRLRQDPRGGGGRHRRGIK